MVACNKVPRNIMECFLVGIFKCLLESWVIDTLHTSVVKIVSKCYNEPTIPFGHNLKLNKNVKPDLDASK